MERGPVLGGSLGTGWRTVRNPCRNIVHRQLGCCRIDAFNLHRNFSCLNRTAIGVSRESFQCYPRSIDNTFVSYFPWAGACPPATAPVASAALWSCFEIIFAMPIPPAAVIELPNDCIAIP